MSHERTEIRSAIKTALIGEDEENPGVYATAAGARVFASRQKKWLLGELPAISIYTDDETVDASSRQTSPRELTRQLRVAVEVATVANDDLDDELDDLALEVETALELDPYLGTKAADMLMVSTDIGIDESGKRPLGLLRMVYSVTYRTDSPRVAPVLEDLETLDTRYNLAGEQDAAEEANDTIEGLEE